MRNTRTILVVVGAMVVAAMVVVVAVVATRGNHRAIGGSAMPASSTTPFPSTTEPAGDRGGADAVVGDCVNLRPVGTSGALAEEIDCAEGDATYEVGARFDGVTTGACPTESYDSYTQTGQDGEFMLCLIMNGDDGDCFSGYSGPDDMKAKVACATADVVVSVTVPDRADPSACPASSGWQLEYPEPRPGRTVCLDPIGR